MGDEMMLGSASASRVAWNRWWRVGPYKGSLLLVFICLLTVCFTTWFTLPPCWLRLRCLHWR